jgi:hypothetical protein
MQTENNMTREDIYVKWANIERFADDLNVCFKYEMTPNFKPDSEAYNCGVYAKEIYGYLMANNDEQIMIDCCKINRAIFYRYGGGNSCISAVALDVAEALRKIHDMALERIWHIGRDDIENCTYYVNSVEGVCRNSSTGELKPKPSTDTPAVPVNAPAKSLPSELDTPEVKAIFDEAKKDGLLNELYQCTNEMTGQMAAYFADRISNVVGMKYKYKPFECFWGKKGFAQARYMAREIVGKLRYQERIDAIFKRLNM